MTRRSITTIVLLTMLSTCSGLPAPARDRGQYAHVDPKMKEWFDSLESRKGPCCSDADGSVVKDADWESRDGHYRVRLQDRWVDVPDEAVVTVPNLFGRTMVWPVYYNGYSEGGNALIYIRCFIPGSMT